MKQVAQYQGEQLAIASMENKKSYFKCPIVFIHYFFFLAGAGIAAFSGRILSYWQSNITLSCPVLGMPSPKKSWTLQYVL